MTTDGIDTFMAGIPSMLPQVNTYGGSAPPNDAMPTFRVAPDLDQGEYPVLVEAYGRDGKKLDGIPWSDEYPDGVEYRMSVDIPRTFDIDIRGGDNVTVDRKDGSGYLIATFTISVDTGGGGGGGGGGGDDNKVTVICEKGCGIEMTDTSTDPGTVVTTTAGNKGPFSLRALYE